MNKNHWINNVVKYMYHYILIHVDACLGSSPFMEDRLKTNAFDVLVLTYVCYISHIYIHYRFVSWPSCRSATAVIPICSVKVLTRKKKNFILHQVIRKHLYMYQANILLREVAKTKYCTSLMISLIVGKK